MKIIELHEPVTAVNDREADALREKLKNNGQFLINLMSSPGSGKTTLLARLIKDLRDTLSIGVIEADIASDVDARAVEALGALSIQAHTGGCCHMDAAMTAEALAGFSEERPELLFLENVGNLICPAEFDTGAHRNLMILSITEGDDKPLKYPLMFETSDALVISKIDALPYFDFDLAAAKARAEMLHPGIPVFPVSAKTGEGMDALEEWIREERQKVLAERAEKAPASGEGDPCHA